MDEDVRLEEEEGTKKNDREDVRVRIKLHEGIALTINDMLLGESVNLFRGHSVKPAHG
jgi:hypothetical protein